MIPITEVRVDQDVCAAHFACTVAPRVFLDTGEGWPVLPENVAALLDSDRAQIIEAAMSCPVAAISVRFADGRVLTSEDYKDELGLRQWIEY